jgi:segregation and condensation protein A
MNQVRADPDVELKEVLLAFQDVLRRADMFTAHQIQREALSVRERMTNVLESLDAENFTEFSTLFTVEEGRMGVVVTLLAILELIKETLIEMIQTEPFGPIYVKAHQHVHQHDAG